MDQKKIGAFLKELRHEKQLTQEQFAEIFGVTNRSVSRWENGVTMPDFDLVIEIANFYDVSVEEILDGERKDEMVTPKTEQTLLKVADFENTEKQRFLRKLCRLFIMAILAFLLYLILETAGLTSTGVYELIASYALGLVLGVLLVGALYTSRYMASIQAFRKRVLCRTKCSDKQTAATETGAKTRIILICLCAVMYAAGIACVVAAILGYTKFYMSAVICFVCATMMLLNWRKKR